MAYLPFFLAQSNMEYVHTYHGLLWEEYSINVIVTQLFNTHCSFSEGAHTHQHTGIYSGLIHKNYTNIHNSIITLFTNTWV